MEAAAGILLQVLDSGTAWSQLHILFRNLRPAVIDGVGRLCGEPLAQAVGQFCLQTAGIDAWVEASESVERVGVQVSQKAGLAFEDGLRVERNPEGCWIAVDAITDEPWRADA